MLTPIAIFAFNRPQALECLLSSLSNCIFFNESPIYIHIDGCRNVNDEPNNNEVIRIAKQFFAVNRISEENLIISKHNKGLGPSIIAGVTSIIDKYGKVIVLEDDLICAPNFLVYMNQALEFYKNNQLIFSICGYGLKIHKPREYTSDFYIMGRSSSWGWGTWKDRWDTVDWDIKDWAQFNKDRKAQKQFNRNGSDMYSMLRDYMNGKNKSWAIRFCYGQFRQKKYSLFPFESKISNEGFGADATNCKSEYSRFKTTLDKSNMASFVFVQDIHPNKKIEQKCYKYHSIRYRIYSKLRNILNL